ncbi:MAG: hypothetical protein ACRDV2_15220 [Actinomycetes bacterium]
MTLIVMTVVVIALLSAVLAIYLFAIGVLLNRIADNLDDCSKNVIRIAGHARAIGPGIKRINKTGGELVGAMPLLVGGAEGVAAKLAPASAAPAASSGAPTAVPASVGYLDV